MILHIFLLILKIIGIILLVILGLVLLLLLFPIKYIGKCQVKESTVTYHVGIGWFFRLLYAGVQGIGADGTVDIRILGIPIKRIKFPEESETEGREKEKQQKIELEENSFQNIKTDTELIKSDDGFPKEKFFEKIKRIYRTIKEKIKAIIVEVKDKKDKVAEIKKTIKSKTTKQAFRFAKTYLFKILKHIRPRKIRGEVTFGMETPDGTGKALGYIAMVFPMFKIPLEKMQINPDFEQKIFEGKVVLKGRVFLGILIIYLLKLYFNRDIKRLMKKFS